MRKNVADRIEELIDSFGKSLSWREVVNDARDEASPLHPEFEWDKAKAHDIYLRDRAQAMLRDWHMQMHAGGDELVRVRRLVSLPTASAADEPAPINARRYYRMEDVLPDSSKRDLLLREALQELSAFRRKYAALSALAGVFAAIDNAEAVASKAA